MWEDEEKEKTDMRKHGNKEKVRKRMIRKQCWRMKKRRRQM